MEMMWPTTYLRRFLTLCCDIQHSHARNRVNGGTPPYNNTQFVTAFAGSFLAFVKSLNPNVHVVPNDITPPWPQWKPFSDAEMLFNRTEDLAPVVHTVKTDKELLTRCK